MSKLIYANFYRLKKDKLFFIAAAATAVMQILMILDRYNINQRLNEENFTLSDVLFEFFPFIGFIFAAFISIFLGKDYSEGIIRNKIIAGHKRENVYLSNFAVCLSGALTIYTVFIIIGLLGIPLLGKWQGGTGNLITYILVGAFACVVFVSVLTMLSMLLTNVPISVVLSIAIMFAMMLLSSIIYNALLEPEFTREIISMSMDSVEYGPEIPNPDYISGFKRELYVFLGEFLPSGQAILMANGEISAPMMNITYSAVLSALVNSIGIILFKKKDLK